MSVPDPAPARKPRNPLRIPLIASLIFNLFVIGALGGWALFGHHGPPPGGGGGGRGGGDVWHWFRNLPDSRRGDLKAMFEAGRDDRRARLVEIDAAWEAATLALQARPYAPEALEAALGRLRRESDSIAEGAYRDILILVGRMTDAERAAYAERVRRQPGGEPPRPPGGRHGEAGREGPPPRP